MSFFPRQTQQPARAHAGLAVLAIVIGKEDGCGGIENNGPETTAPTLSGLSRLTNSQRAAERP